MEQELNRLLEQVELVNAMAKSVDEAQKKLSEETQEFFTKHLGIPKGAQMHFLELVKKAIEAKG